MLVKCTNKLVDLVDFTDEQYKKLGVIFRAVAGKQLAECKDFKGVLKKCGIEANGENEQLAREIYLNCAILSSTAEKDETIYLSEDRAIMLCKKMGNPFKKVSIDEVSARTMKSLGIESNTDDEYEEEQEEYEDSYSGWGNNEEEDYSEDEEDVSDKDLEEWEKEVEDDVEEAIAEEVQREIDEEDKKEKSKGKLSKEDKDSIKGYYYQLYNGLVSELSKRYTSLFESGYEVVKPAGILSTSGLLSLSGSSVSERNNIALRNIYNIFLKRMDFQVCFDRSNIRIADMIYDSYHKGRKLIYFPFKLIEYAYGRMAPDGDDQNSENTYKKHSNASNWSAYCKSEVNKSLRSVIEASVVRFVVSTSENKGIDYFDDSIAKELRSYLRYLENCLSLCILVVEYKGKVRGYVENIYSFKIRVCDPCNGLGSEDLTEIIINDAFMGSTGEVPFSYKPRFEENTFIKEYAHEFNHNSSQASPLFAYKAYQALKMQDVEPTWNNMVLGMFEDGTILKNGKHGVSLENRLTHHLVAGSRAGKGVMTLNILASGIYSGKNIFYLDRKPDMASLFKNISPSMFVVNGGGYGEQYDTFKQFNNIDSMVNWGNVPDYVCDTLGCTKNWDSLGDLFYMRALKLVMGIIVARGDGQITNPAFGGNDGVLLVVDEFKNFQENFSVIVEKFVSKIPPCSYTSDLVKMQDGKIEESKFTKSYNDGTFYALTYMNSLVGDLEFLSTRRDAGFNQAEIACSDVFVIGQHLGYGDLDFRKIRSAIADATSSDRYRGCGVTGLKGKILGVADSFPFSMVSFKTCDAFFGRNMEDGRSVYLAQTNPNSKAFGRLDDKASNFAYMGTFTEDVRKDIISGNVSKNVSMANSCTYFKPFLVLNDSIVGGNCVEGMFARCAGPNPDEPWITREELIAENPNQDGTYINSAVGFEDYLLMMGISDYKERLAKSGDIANYVVQKCLGYNGSWFEFITDLRPEWCFSIRDIVDGAKGIQPVLLDAKRNPIMSEFVRFNPNAFGLGDGVDSGNEDLGSTSTFDYMDDYSDISEDIRNYEMDRLYEDDSNGKEIDDICNSLLNKDEPINIFNDDLYTSVLEDSIKETNRGNYTEDSVIKGTGVSKGEADELIARLKEMGFNVTIDEPKTESEKAFYEDEEFGECLYRNAIGDLNPFGHSDESEFTDTFEYKGTVESKTDLVNLVTDDILAKFGGLKEIVSFKVIGGSIVVNGYYYRCKAGELFSRGLPYDLRREISSGSIARLFDYSKIKNMPRLRDLEFDSTSFVYDYVSYGMGYGSSISVDSFFRDIRSLQRLCIGKKLFKRDTYMEQIKGDDVFYNPRLTTKLADCSEEVLGRFSKSSWEFTKNTFKSKEYGKIVKFLGVSGGVVATAATTGGKLAVRGSRKAFNGLKALGRSIKNVIEETKKY